MPEAHDVPSYIAFLRAVNVGRRQVKMAALRGHLEEQGFSDVETFIASGNVRLTSSLRSPVKVEQRLETVLETWLGFGVPTLVRTPAELTAAFEAGEGLLSPVGDSRHYLTFLKDEPSVDAAQRLSGWDEPGERVTMSGREVHLWLASTSPKLTNTRLERILGTLGTARDWKTVTKLAALWC